LEQSNLDASLRSANAPVLKQSAGSMCSLGIHVSFFAPVLIGAVKEFEELELEELEPEELDKVEVSGELEALEALEAVKDRELASLRRSTLSSSVLSAFSSSTSSSSSAESRSTAPLAFRLPVCVVGGGGVNARGAAM